MVCVSVAGRMTTEYAPEIIGTIAARHDFHSREERKTAKSRDEKIWEILGKVVGSQQCNRFACQ